MSSLLPDGARRLLRPSNIIMLLPVLGLVVTTPYLLLSPVYIDEIQWKMINSRLWLDGGKLLYLFPACTKGFLLNVPMTWYPSRVIDSLLFADMGDPQRLRFWGLGTFLAIVLYASWAARRLVQPKAPFVCVFGAVLAPLTLGVLPFLLVFSRPEQPIVLSLLLGCTLPFVLPSSQAGNVRSWVFVALYTFLAWTMTAAHLKAIYFLPVLLFAAFIMVRSWLPRIVLCATFGYSAVETLNIWLARTDCPESPFLMQVFHNLSLSPADLGGGLSPFIHRWVANLLEAPNYWDRIAFQLDYQNFWLPHSSAPLSELEVAVNKTPEIAVVLGLLVVAAGIFRSLRFERMRVAWVGRPGAMAALLVLPLIALAGMQTTKNFYEAGLGAPLLGLAVMLALPGLLSGAEKFRKAGLAAVIALACVSTVSQVALAARFSANLPMWFAKLSKRQMEQADVAAALDRCRLPIGLAGSHIAMDDLAYTVLWRTREPIVMAHVSGWWATGMDLKQLVHDRNIIGFIGKCTNIPPAYQPEMVAEGRYCCSRVEQ